MRGGLRAFVFGVMRSLYRGIDARTRNCIPYVLWKRVGRVGKTREPLTWTLTLIILIYPSMP
jgi:hypothetical protein